MLVDFLISLEMGQAYSRKRWRMASVDQRRGSFPMRVSQLISEHIHEILQGDKTGVRYTFETIGRESLRQEHLDSPEFIRFCESE